MQKAPGHDDIPSEVLRNNIAVTTILEFFNHCFSSGMVPSECSKGIITPIPKNSTADTRDPLSYKGSHGLQLCTNCMPVF